MNNELKKQVLSKFNEYTVASLRLNVFGAELDNKMRSQMRKDQKEEPTNLTYTYLYQLRKELIELFKEDDICPCCENTPKDCFCTKEEIKKWK